MAEAESFDALMQRLKDGENAAAREVFERFAHRLIGLARSSLDDRILQKVDPEDVVQSAYKSFFVRQPQREGELAVGGWDGLWGLLTLITLRKCADKAEYYRAEKRDLRRETPPATDSSATSPDGLALDREPRPDEAAVLVETMESLFRSLADADERTILELCLHGYTTAEICERTNRAERTVRRLRERTRKRIERMRQDH